MRKILITGGAGNVGSSLAMALARDPKTHVVVVDNLLTGCRSKITTNDNLSFVKADVNNFRSLSTIMLSHHFDYVFHYAAVVGVRRTLENPISVLEDIDGIKNVLELSNDTGVKRGFFSSSSEVYGEPVESPQHEETTPLNSRLPYAIVKNVGEAYFRSYQKEHGLDYTIFRFFNTYGPNQTADFVIIRFLKQALRNEPITVLGDGSQTRTFCFIEDNIKATTRALDHNKIINDVINIGNDQEITIRELAELVKRVTNSNSEIVHLPARKEGDMSSRQPCIKKMRDLVDEPLTSLEAGLQKTIESIEPKQTVLTP